MGIFLSELLGPKISPHHHTTHHVSSSKDHFLQFQILYRLLVQDTAILHQFLSDTPLSFFRYNPFPISFCTPVLASSDKSPSPKAGKTVPVNQGMESIQLTPVKIQLRFSCCGLIAFLTFLLSCLSFLHMPPVICQLVIWLRQ